MKYQKLISFIIFLQLVTGSLFYGCKQREETTLFEKIINDKALEDEKAIFKISKIAFGNEFRDAKVKKDKEGMVSIDIRFGGTAAYTFANAEQYRQNYKMQIAIAAGKIFKASQNRKLKEIKVRLVKPFFLTENPDEQKEFEIFRIVLDTKTFGEIPGEVSLQLLGSGETNSPRTIFLEAVQKKWKVELDEFDLVEIK